MTLLLDTHLLLWVAGDSGRLSFVIKNALGRSDFRVEPQLFRDGLIQNGYRELAVRSEHSGKIPAKQRSTVSFKHLASADQCAPQWRCSPWHRGHGESDQHGIIVREWIDLDKTCKDKLR